jgi:alkylation response protein AidB-like acyl-CoA dehydrogenase
LPIEDAMDFALSDEERMIEETAASLAADHLAPHAGRLDRGEGREILLSNLGLLAENGFMGLNIDEAYGGSAAGAVAYALSVGALGSACASTAVTVSVTNLVGEVIQSVGSEEQKAAYLPKLCDGTFASGAFCLTEPGAGSDPSGMTTRAVMDGNEWVLNGGKIYITSAEYAGLFIVWAVTDPEAPRGRGISCFLVEAGTPGMAIGKAERKMGQTGSATNAQFGSKIGDMQGVQWMIADRETELEAARLLILQAACLKDRGEPFGREASMAKLFASEAAQKATYTALQLHGGAGYLADYPLERYARDARVTTIYEGTSEIQRMIIARETLKNLR